MKEQIYRERFYRQWPHTQDLVSFRVQISQSDLMIRAEKDIEWKACELLLNARNYIETYIKENPRFGDSLKPIPVDSSKSFSFSFIFNTSLSFSRISS